MLDDQCFGLNKKKKTNYTLLSEPVSETSETTTCLHRRILEDFSPSFLWLLELSHNLNHTKEKLSSNRHVCNLLGQQLHKFEQYKRQGIMKKRCQT